MFDEENIGIFWGIIETRPYMRARHNRVLVLMSLGRDTEAIKECEELLKLCVNDNMGMRYLLIAMYCLLEKFDKCKELFERYDDYSLQMTIVMAIMYFKKGEYKKVKEFLNYCEGENEYIIDFLIGENMESLSQIDPDEQYYALGSEEEAFMTINNIMYLLISVPTFLSYVKKIL